MSNSETKLSPRQAAKIARDEAKERLARSRAARKAEQKRKGASGNIADMNIIAQVRQAYKLTKEHDPSLPWFLLGAAFAPIIIGVIVAVLTQNWLFPILIGVLLAPLLSLMLLTRRVRLASYKRFAGQPGSGEIALNELPKKYIKSPSITANKNMDTVHRVVGPSGIVLIGEGEPGRLKSMLADQQKKHERIAYGMPVTVVFMGNKEGQIELSKLKSYIKKMPKRIQTFEVVEVSNRLRALDSVRPKVPIPKGPMPTSAKGMRKNLRG